MLRQLVQYLCELGCGAIRTLRYPDRIVVCAAPVPEGNRGDQALLDVVIREIQEQGVSRITIYATSQHPIHSFTSTERLTINHRDHQLFGTLRSFRERLAFVWALGDVREMVMIGADVLDEGYGVDRSEASLYALELAAKLGVECRIFGFSVNGPPSEGLQKRLQRIAPRVRLLARDPLSFSRIFEAGVKSVQQVGDLAYLLNEADIEEVPTATREFLLAYRGKLLALNLTPVVLKNAAESCCLTSFQTAIAGLVRAGWRVVLLPHDEPEGASYLQDFHSRLEEPAKKFVHLVSPLPHARVLKRIVGCCEHLFTCRLHLGIAALGMGRPVTAFPYQGKFEGQWALFELDRGLIPVDHLPHDAQELENLMLRRIEEGKEDQVKIRRNLPKVQALARKNFEGLGDPSLSL